MNAHHNPQSSGLALVAATIAWIVILVIAAGVILLSLPNTV